MRTNDAPASRSSISALNGIANSLPVRPSNLARRDTPRPRAEYWRRVPHGTGCAGLGSSDWLLYLDRTRGLSCRSNRQLWLRRRRTPRHPRICGRRDLRSGDGDRGRVCASKTAWSLEPRRSRAKRAAARGHCLIDYEPLHMPRTIEQALRCARLALPPPVLSRGYALGARGPAAA